MKRLMVLLLTGVVFLQGCAMASELVDEVKQVRENNPHPALAETTK